MEMLKNYLPCQLIHSALSLPGDVILCMLGAPSLLTHVSNKRVLRIGDRTLQQIVHQTLNKTKLISISHPPQQEKQQ